MKEMWNERFAQSDYFYGLEPNPQFKAFIDELEPGSILLPGEGEGRNAVYAARKGWKVTAVDFSEEGKRKALALAEQHQVSINYLIADVTSLKGIDSSFDVVAPIFLHLPPDILLPTYTQLINYLKPSGYLFVTGFNTDQLKHQSGGPRNIEWLFEAMQFTTNFPQLQALKDEAFRTTLTEGAGHNGEAEILVFIGTKS